MLTPCSMSRRLTTRPAGPVWGVTRVMPRIFWAISTAAIAPLTTLTPPALPRPPAWIWALTTRVSLPVSVISALAARSASPGEKAGVPLGTGTPYFRRISLAWYSWIFISELLRRFDELFDGRRRLVQHCLLGGVELDGEHLLDAAGADHHRHSHVEVAVAVLSFEVSGRGQQALGVAQVGLGHLDGGGGGGVVGAGPHQLDDLAAAVAGALDDRLQLVGGDQLADRHAVHRAVADHRHHGVAVPAQHHGPHVLDGDAELAGEEELEAAGVEHAGHPHHALAEEAGHLLELVHHGVERVGDDDDEGVGALRLQVLRDVADDLEVDAEEIVARHPRLARDAGGDDHDLRPGQVVPAGGAGDAGVVAEHGAVLLEIEGLALGHPDLVGDVEEKDVAELATRGQRG